MVGASRTGLSHNFESKRLQHNMFVGLVMYHNAHKIGRSCVQDLCSAAMPSCTRNRRGPQRQSVTRQRWHLRRQRSGSRGRSTIRRRQIHLQLEPTSGAEEEQDLLPEKLVGVVNASSALATQIPLCVVFSTRRRN